MTELRTPIHIAIIMDGNNRWARLHGRPILGGHSAGADALRQVITKCIERGVHTLSVFAFSSENWSRPKLEVDGLMHLFEKSLNDEISELTEHKIAIQVIGDRSRFSETLRRSIDHAEHFTKSGTRLKLNIMANYGGRWDIVDTARRLAEQVDRGEISSNAIDERLFESRQNLAGQADVDLLIRTGGEHRFSNFLLWQSAYAELVFSNVLWPDFDGETLDQCLMEFTNRERRFGQTSEQAGAG